MWNTYTQTYIYKLTFVRMCLCAQPDLPEILAFCKKHRRKWNIAFGKNGWFSWTEDKKPSMICNFSFHLAPLRLQYVMSLELKIPQEEWCDTHCLLTAKI